MRIFVVLISMLWNSVSSFAQDPCVAYQTDFESFDAPVDAVGDTWSIEWCQRGGSVAASGFCPSGQAYRLAGASDQLAASVSLHPSCEEMSISFTISSLFETNSRLELREACTGEVLAEAILPTSGGVCTAFEFWVVPPASSFVLAWVHGGAATSIVLLDEVHLELYGCCDIPHECCEVGSPSCEDAEVAACVCAVDPYCCETAWDALCVDHIESESCGTCGSMCSEVFDATFGTVYQPGGPCVAFPDLIASCWGEGPWLTIGGTCSSADDVAVRFGEGFPFSTFETVCVSLAETSVARLEFEYTSPIGVYGPVVEVVIGGEATTIFEAEMATSSACRLASISLGAYLGEESIAFRFSSGSVLGSNTVVDEVRLAMTCHVPCGDLDGDGIVGGSDLGVLLGVWGMGDPDADFDLSGVVDAADLGILLSLFGS